MTHFTIDADNNIAAHATAAEARVLEGGERFSNEGALAKLAANWPATRLVEMYNSLTGVTPVKKFKGSQHGCSPDLDGDPEPGPTRRQRGRAGSRAQAGIQR